MDALEQILNAGGSGPARRNSRVAIVSNRRSVALDLQQKPPQTAKNINRSISMLDDIAEQIAKAEQDNAKYDS
jgi:hypothetical protein